MQGFMELPEGDSPMARAVRVILHEHRAFASVLAALERLADDVVERNAKPDFGLFASMLYYVDIFPERFHHPKETQHLFHALRIRKPEAFTLLDRLEGEHDRTEWMLLAMDRCLVAFQADAPEGARHFRDAAAAFSHFHFSHMEVEEQELIPLCQAHLLPQDWDHIAQAFEANQDPAFGAAAQQRFDRLRQRIEGQAPPKMRRLLRRYGDD